MASVKNFIRSSDRVVEFRNYFDGLKVESHTRHTLEAHRKQIDRIWLNFESCYEAAMDNYETIQEQIDLETLKGRFYSTFDNHTAVVAKIHELNEALQANAKTASPSNDSTRDMTPHISLPPCDTEVFHGDYKSWPTFRDMFTALYRNNKRLSPVEKMCHLVKKTQGEARELLKTCPMTNDGFNMAWQNLVHRYENKRILVNAQLKSLFNIKPISKETGSDLRRLQRTINDCITNLRLLHIEADNWDVIFVYICSTCLPETTLSLWEQSLPRTTNLPTWKALDDFLSSRFQTLESVADIRSTFINSHAPTPSKTSSQGTKVKSYQTNVSPENRGKCALCPEFHPLRCCAVFLAMSIEDRYATVKKQNKCTNSLGTSHGAKTCQSKFTCKVCKGKHHSLLHRVERKKTPVTNTTVKNTPVHHNNNQLPDLDVIPSISSQVANRTLQSFSTHLEPTTQSVILGTALVDVYNNDLKCTVRALIDSASEATFISKKLQRHLGLHTRPSAAQVHGLSDSVTATSTQSCHVRIGSPVDKSFEIFSDALVINRLTGHLPYYPSSALKDGDFTNLQWADTYRHSCREIDLLLGADVYPKIIQDGLQRDTQQTLLAQNTVFGWIITGMVPAHPCRKAVLSFFNTIELNNQLQRFWELEDIPKRKTSSPEDTYCENLYTSTTFRNKEGRYVVSLPFKKDYPEKLNIGPSRKIAFSQFLRNEARLIKNPQLKTEYDQVITEYSTLGQMTKVTPVNGDSGTYYLPHHAVLKPDSTTTKLRVVFNASSPSSNGISLNDLLHPGPVLQSDLMILLLRWRFFRYVFNADIEKMYRQILVHPKHTPFQRILHRESPNVLTQDFELNTVTFGVNCALYLAIRTLLELAKESESTSPKASEILRNHMYVDDVLSGAHTISSAVKFRDELIAVLETAGFALRKWTSNNEMLLQGLPSTHLLGEEFLQLSESSITKTLGLGWNAGNDHFYFKLKANPNRELTTKRCVLSEIAKLFDPAGWLSPKIIMAKMIMQQIWKDGTDWDEDLNPLTMNKWREFLDDYINIEEVRIPRCIDYDPSYKVELHAFCDASEKAYAAAIYIRSENEGFVTSHLLAAKSKVAPVKFVSLPRKELCGAELLANMIDSIQAQLNLKDYKLFLWTDSTIVLAWLRKPAHKWKTFVENRVSSIVEKVGKDSWSHVESKSNPADLASRGITIRDLSSSELWWRGPVWLRRPPSDWPSRGKEFDTEEDIRTIRAHTTLIKKDDILENFSDLPRALRVIGYIFRFYKRTRAKLIAEEISREELSAKEIVFVKNRLIIACQKSHFTEEYSQLSERTQLSRKSSLLACNPFLDSTGIMRINGRLADSPTLSYDERYPILLPYHARFTRLFLMYLHKYSLHGQNALLYRLTRLRYYVPKLKMLIKTILSQCVTCVRHKRQLGQQIMAALPPERASLSRPFCHTGVDFAGPFDIKSYAGRGCKVTKGYVLVFVCFSTKAIHLEATGDISTQAFLAAFARFFSRRGTPQDMYSDNGTAFVGAANVLHGDQQHFLSKIQKGLLSQDVFTPVDWHFIPPGAPHMGGLWEAGVKSFKAHFKKLCHSQSFTYEEFSTMLARIEACLNSRPLSPMNENPTDLCALTPGHFLVGTPLLSPPEPDLSSHSLSYVNRWQKLKILHHHLARRWKEEYLTELHKRNKWKHPQRDFVIGDLVVVRQDNLPPNQWRLGRIEKIFTGPDNRVRVSEIRTANGIVTRPIVKLVLLPLLPTA